MIELGAIGFFIYLILKAVFNSMNIKQTGERNYNKQKEKDN